MKNVVILTKEMRIRRGNDKDINIVFKRNENRRLRDIWAITVVASAYFGCLVHLVVMDLGIKSGPSLRYAFSAI